MQKCCPDLAQTGTDGAASLTAQRVTNIRVTGHMLPVCGAAHLSAPCWCARVLRGLLHWSCPPKCWTPHILLGINWSTLPLSFVIIYSIQNWLYFCHVSASLGNLPSLRRQEALCGHAGETTDWRWRKENVWTVWKYRGVHGAPWAW